MSDPIAPEPTTRYVHGTSPREQERLQIMNDVLNRGALAAIDLRGGERILDLGSGTGQLSRALARAAGGRAAGGRAAGGRASLVAVERSEEQLREAVRLAREAGEQDLVDFRLGDALAPPLRDDEWGRFDLAHTRFLLEHLPQPLEAVRIMRRAVRPGGRIVLQDEDHTIMRLWPDPPGVDAMWQAYVRSYEQKGNDPRIGIKLAALLHQAGARPARSSWVNFGACAGETRFPALVENLARVLEGAREAVVATGLMDLRQCDAALAALRAWGERPDAALVYALACVEGVRPENS